MRHDLSSIISQAPAWYHGYFAAVPEGDILDLLQQQAADLEAAFSSLPPGKLDQGYAPGKWSPKELLGHITDAERVFQYRILRFARADATPLPGFEEDDYVAAAEFNRQGMENLLAQFAAVRQSTLLLARSLDGPARARQGSANGNPVTVEALIWIIVGHTAHHLKVLSEKY